MVSPLRVPRQVEIWVCQRLCADCFGAAEVRDSPCVPESRAEQRLPVWPGGAGRPAAVLPMTSPLGPRTFTHILKSQFSHL